MQVLSEFFLNILMAVGNFMCGWFVDVARFCKQLFRPIRVRCRLAVRQLRRQKALRKAQRAEKKEAFRLRLQEATQKAEARSAGKSGLICRLSRGFARLGVYLRRPRLFRTVLNYAMPVAACALFLFVVSYVSSMPLAIAVEYNGTQLGYVKDETVFNQAETRLQDRMVYLNEEEIVSETPRFVVTVVEEEQIIDDSALTDGMIQSSRTDIVEATGLTIDGEFYGAVLDGEFLQNTLDGMLEEYRTDNPEETVSFVKDVKVESGLYRTQNLISQATMMEILTGEVEKDVYYSIVWGDAPISIARKNNMTLDELMKLNPDLMTNCKVGNQVLVKKSQSFLPVKTTRVEVYTEDVPYGYEYIDSLKYYEGTKITTRAGIDGEQSVTAEVDYVDGYEIGRRVQQVNVLKAPVNALVTRGVLEIPATSNITDAMRSDKGFIWPVWGGYISQYWKPGKHNGIDYAYHGLSGSPIVAAVPGKVIYAGWRGTYGRLVIIETIGGIQTWYAHCSKLLVSAGQQVKQGQQIAKVGSTGRSTGPHLHFRVLVNGIEKNPMNYLP